MVEFKDKLKSYNIYKFDVDEDLRGLDAHYAATIQAAIGLAEEKCLFRLDRMDLARRFGVSGRRRLVGHS